MLGNHYKWGEGVPSDNRAAAEWALKAYAQGQINEQHNLGYIYLVGLGVPQDYQQAASWYRKAAEQCDIDSLTYLGEMYEKGQGVPKDFVLAYMLYNLNATEGSDFGRKRRDAISGSMTPQQIDEAQALSRNWEIGTPLPTQSKTGRSK